jgi:TonB-dependent starch-binding outer membrane protein SusC
MQLDVTTINLNSHERKQNMNGKWLRKLSLPYQRSISSSGRVVSKAKGFLLFSLILVLVAVLGYGEAFAQESVQVTGVVTDAQDGSPIPGVNVIVQGSQQATGSTVGTVTSIDGEYSLNVPQNLNVLVFSFVGYQTSTIQIDGRSQINVELQQDLQLLDDVVVDLGLRLVVGLLDPGRVDAPVL